MENTKRGKAKRIAGIVINVLLWAFVIFAVLVTVIAVSASVSKKGVPTIGGRCYLSVQSDSMHADPPEWVADDQPRGFKTGDLIFGTYIADDETAIAALRRGDVITFAWDIDGDGIIGQGEYNTHRIVHIVYDGDEIVYFETQGDNAAYSRGQTEAVYPSRIIAHYTGKRLGGVGSAITALQSPLGFGLCIVLPLALFFCYELFIFIRTLVKMKNEGKRVITAADEELIKQRAVAEYLRLRREAEEASTEETGGEDASFRGE